MLRAPPDRPAQQGRDDPMTKRILHLAASMLLLGVVAACGAGAGTPGSVDNPRLDEARAREIALVQLDAFNSCDYQGWSTSWATSLSSAIDAPAFKGFCEGWLAQAGSYRSLDSVSREPAKTEGHVKYVFTTTWEKGSAVYSFVLPVDGEEITGVNLVPAS
jgi:hypothetical protein